MMAAARRSLWPSPGLTLSGLDFQAPLSPGLAHDPGRPHAWGLPDPRVNLHPLCPAVLFTSPVSRLTPFPSGSQLCSLRPPEEWVPIFHEKSCGDSRRTCPTHMDVCFSGQPRVLWALSPSGQVPTKWEGQKAMPHAFQTAPVKAWRD